MFVRSSMNTTVIYRAHGSKIEIKPGINLITNPLITIKELQGCYGTRITLVTDVKEEKKEVKVVTKKPESKKVETKKVETKKVETPVKKEEKITITLPEENSVKIVENKEEIKTEVKEIKTEVKEDKKEVTIKKEENKTKQKGRRNKSNKVNK